MFYILDGNSNGKEIYYLRGNKAVIVDSYTESDMVKRYQSVGYSEPVACALTTGALGNMVTTAHLAKNRGLINSRSVTIIEARDKGLIV